MTSTPPQGPLRVVTLPNVVSFARLAILLPLSMWLLLTDRWWWALGALAVLGWTDWLDGFLARRLHQQSLFGARLDPVADRISVVGVSIALAAQNVVPWWALAVIAVVDLTLLCLAAAWFRGSPDLPVSRIGKWRTAALFLALPLLIVAAGLDSAWLRWVGLGMLAIGVLGHIVAGIGYMRGMARKRRAR
ncbi:CDP-alcohol phosphatidyltransferase family protein [Salana multivorans]